MFTIKRAAALVGVSESTLRAWDRRYGAGASARSDAGYRLYSEHDVRSLVTLKQLVDQGWAPAAAAVEARERSAATSPESAQPSSVPPSSVPRSSEVADSLVPLAQTFDVRALGALLDSRFAAASFESVVDTWLMPALSEVGQAWEDGLISVSGEHFVSHGVARRLSTAFEAAGERSDGPQVVVGLPPGSRHDLGLLAFATAARRAGLAVRYLGTDVPVIDWVSAVNSPAARTSDAHPSDTRPSDVACAVISAPLGQDVSAMVTTVNALRESRPDLVVAVGGGHQEFAPAECLRLGHRIGDAAQFLTGHLRRED